METNTTLRHFSIADNHFSCTSLAEAIKNSKTLQSVNLSNTNYMDNTDYIRSIIGIIKVNSTLQGLSEIARALKINRRLMNLNISGYKDDTTVAIYELSEALKTNVHLEILYLDSHPHAKPDAFVQLAKALETNKNLRELSLEKCNLGSEVIAAIAVMLTKNTSLNKLKLSHNPIGNTGISKLAQALQTNKSLEELLLAHAHIDDESIDNLAEAIAKSNIKCLDLTGNNITDRGVILLAKKIQSNSTLTKLKLDEPRLGPDGKEALHNINLMLMRNRGVHSHLLFAEKCKSPNEPLTIFFKDEKAKDCLRVPVNQQADKLRARL